MGIVDRVMTTIGSKDKVDSHNETVRSHHDTGAAALADAEPSQINKSDKMGGSLTRNLKDAVTHEAVSRHAHHEVDPVVHRTREQVEIHQKVQPVTDTKETHTHHHHQAPDVHREKAAEIHPDHHERYIKQAQVHKHEQTVGEQTHSTSVNAPVVHEKVNKHIVEEIQPVVHLQHQNVEHHHTTQHIHESHREAPIVHKTVENPSMTLEEFKQAIKP